MTTEKKRWALLDCGLYPSVKDCKVKLMAPEEQLDEILDLAVVHAVKSHGHEDNDELRKGIREIIQIKEM